MRAMMSWLTASMPDSTDAMLGKATSVIKRHEVSGECQNGQYTGAHTAPDDQPLGGYPIVFLVAAVVAGSTCTILVYDFRRESQIRQAPCPGRGLHASGTTPPWT